MGKGSFDPRPGGARRPGHRPACGQILEEITGADELVIGTEVEAFFARRAYLRDTGDEALLGALIALPAAHHGVDALAEAVLPEVRTAIGCGILYQAQ